jgi:cellulose biosynthesis protein BcsQ
MNEIKKPIIISIVSGKGGCGKTRIAITLAQVLSQTSKVLLIDLDLYNQGLTTLLKQKVSEQDPTVYGLVYENRSIEKIDLDKKNEIRENIFFLPGIYEIESGTFNLIRKLEKEYDIPALKMELEKLVNSLSDRHNLDCIIIDNTGLPDIISISSALCSNKTLIITQPDSVTWKGALNFYINFKNNGGDENLVNFVINNVPKKFSSVDLTDIFGGYDFNFISNIPFEYGIFESFGRDPFDVVISQSSLFYRKITLMAARILKDMNRQDLFSEDMTFSERHEEKISKDLKEEYARALTPSEIKYRANKYLVVGMIFMSIGAYIILTMLDVIHPETILLLMGILALAFGFYFYILGAKESFFKLRRRKHL